MTVVLEEGSLKVATGFLPKTQCDTHDVSNAGSVSVLRYKGGEVKKPIQLGEGEVNKANLSHFA